MNTRLIFQLSLFGVFMALSTVFWISPSAEPFFWLMIFIICAYFVALKCENRFFLHGFMISLLNGLWMTLAHMIFFNQYVATHPEELGMMSKFPLHIPPILAMLFIGPFFGALFGIILGIFCVVASKLLNKEKSTS